MASPSTREQLKDYALRKLGFPVIDINVDDDQLEDRIDDALQKYRDYHYDGTEEIYLATQLTANNIANGYIDVSDNIVGITRIMPVTGDSVSSQNGQGFNIFDINYQLRLNDFYSLTASSYTYYYIARTHLAMLDMIVTGEVPFRYNKTVNRVTVYMDWNARLSTNDYMVMQAQRIIDPETYSKVYNDSWLKEYTAALFKKQWGANLSKYANYALPGGLVVNGEAILRDATQEVELLEQKLRDVFEYPPMMIVG